MEENVQEKKTFKWGDSEYLLDDLLKLHADQEQNYYNFAKDKGNYDDSAIQGLRTAITNRINAAKSGRVFGADGSLDDDVVDNITIQVPGKGLRKRRGATTVDQDNTAWSRYYISQLVKNLSPYQREAVKEKGNWDIAKHGLEAYLTGQGVNAKDVFENYDGRDANNPEAARSFSQRDTKLREHLGKYRTWLEGKGFDFTKNDNEWDDNFMTTLSDLINNQDWSDRTALSASLRKLGAGENYTAAFTSDRWDLSKSNEEIEAERKAAADKKKKEEMDKAWGDEKARRYGIYSGLSDLRSGQMQQYLGKDKIFDATDEDINYHMASKKISGAEAEKAYWDDLDRQYAANPYDISVAQLILPMRARQGALKSIDSGDYSGWNYDPSTINDSRQSVMAFDPTTGKMEEIFIGHLTNDWARIKNQFMQKQGYTDPLAAFAKEGGVLEFQTGGTFSSYDYIQSYKKDKNAERAAETGNAEDIQKARDRVVSNGDKVLKSEDATLAQPDAGFTGAEIARLASIGADITSLFLDPITGVAVGLGSTLTNFGADIADDGFQWQDVKNLGINAGFDLLGAVPIFGDAFGTGAKITKNLVKWAPRIMAGMAAYQGVKNFDGIMGSWGKLTSGDKEQKLTVQDWRNIAQSISLVTGGVRAGKNKLQQSKMRSEARVLDADGNAVLGINVRNKNSGDIEQILVDGDVAKRVRNAKGDTAEIEKILNDTDAYKGKFGENGDLAVNSRTDGSWQSPVHRREIQDGSGKKEWEYRGFRKDGKADVSEVYDFSQVTTGYGAGRGFKIPGVSDRLNKWHQDLVAKANANMTPTQVDRRGMMTNEGIEVERNRLLEEGGFKDQIGKVQEAVTARQKYLEKLEGTIGKAQSHLDADNAALAGMPSVAEARRYKSQANRELRGLPSDADLDVAMRQVSDNQAIITRNKARHASLTEAKNKALGQIEARKKQLESDLRKAEAVVARKTEIEALLAKKGKGKPSADERIRLNQELDNINARINSTFGDIDALRTSTTTRLNELQVSKTKVIDTYARKFSDLALSTKKAKSAVGKAQPTANKKKAIEAARARITSADDVIARRPATESRANNSQQRLSALQGKKTSLDPSRTPTSEYTALQQMVADLQLNHGTIGGKAITWDMADILQKYGVKASDVFKQGGSINRNKINKFLNYAKG